MIHQQMVNFCDECGNAIIQLPYRTATNTWSMLT